MVRLGLRWGLSRRQAMGAQNERGEMRGLRVRVRIRDKFKVIFNKIFHPNISFRNSTILRDFLRIFCLTQVKF